MKSKISIFLTFATVLIVAGTTWTKSSRQENTKELGTVASRVQEAKRVGKKQVEVPAPVPIYAAVNGLEDAFSRFTAVVAQPVEEKSYLQDRNRIITWYKFKVLEYLSQPPHNECPECLNDIIIPEDLLPLRGDEFVVPYVGGSVMVDGVKVFSRDSKFRQSFSLSQKYLLFLSLDPSRGIGSLSIGPSGVFSIDSDDILLPVTKAAHPLVNDIERATQSSLSKVKEHIRGHLH